MVRHAIHISEADAVNDFVAVLSRVRAGDEIIIDGQEAVVVAVRRTPPGRLLSESIALARLSQLSRDEGDKSLRMSTW